LRDLAELRGEIDALDSDLARLFRHRLKVVDKIASVKRESGALVCDSGREAEILARVAVEAGEGYAEDVCRLFASIFDISRARQLEAMAN